MSKVRKGLQRDGVAVGLEVADSKVLLVARCEMEILRRSKSPAEAEHIARTHREDRRAEERVAVVELEGNVPHAQVEVTGVRESDCDNAY